MNDPYKPPQSELDTEVSEGLKLASRGTRLLGAFLDGIFTGIPMIGLAFYLGIYDNMTPEGALPFKYQLLASLFGIGFFMLVNGYLIYKRGQTVGKMICRTRVVTLEGKQVSGNTYVFLRLLPIWVASQIPVMGGVVGLVDALLIFRKERNCLHDDIAKTRVIDI